MITLNGKKIKNYPNYLAIPSGEIYSLKTKRILKPFISNNGYLMVSLCNNGKVKKYLVHRLIAETFIPNSNNRWVNHKDGIKTNNNVSNLEWVTPSENNKHSYLTGLNVPKRGEDHFAAKLSNEQVNEIRELLRQGKFYSEIAKIYDVTISTIGMIKRGQRRLS